MPAHKRYRVVSYRWAASRTILASYDDRGEAESHARRLEAAAPGG